MKKLFGFLLLCFCFSLVTFSAVIPRYKAKLNFHFLVLNGDSLLKPGPHFTEISFYEESEIAIICSTGQGDAGARILGRPVWREGKITHHFMVQFFFRKPGSDKWDLIAKREIKNWEGSPSLADSSTGAYPYVFTHAIGRFIFSYDAGVELLQNDYSPDIDSSFLPMLVFDATQLRINGKKVVLKQEHFEEMYKRKGTFSIGTYHKSPIHISYIINRGSANHSKEFQAIVYYSIKEKNGEITKRELTSEFFSLQNPPRFQSIQIWDDLGGESLFLEFKLGVIALN